MQPVGGRDKQTHPRAGITVRAPDTLPRWIFFRLCCRPSGAGRWDGECGADTRAEQDVRGFQATGLVGKNNTHVIMME